MESIIQKKYRMDFLIISSFAVFTWGVLLFVLKTVYVISPVPIVKAAAIISCGLVGIFSTSALLAVLVHLKNNRTSIYREDILNERK